MLLYSVRGRGPDSPITDHTSKYGSFGTKNVNGTPLDATPTGTSLWCHRHAALPASRVARRGADSYAKCCRTRRGRPSRLVPGSRHPRQCRGRPGPALWEAVLEPA